MAKPTTITQAEQNAQVTELKRQRAAVKDAMRGLSKDSKEWQDGKAEATRLHDEIEAVRAITVEG